MALIFCKTYYLNILTKLQIVQIKKFFEKYFGWENSTSEDDESSEYLDMVAKDGENMRYENIR